MALPPIDSSLLLDFINRFQQYGNPSAAFWFVGIEEAGVTDPLLDLPPRLSAWEQLGKKPVVDIKDFHVLIGQGQFFNGATPPLQRTWAKLILLLLTALKKPGDTDDRRKYQRDEWGRTNGATFVTELLPLPVNSGVPWPYGPLAGQPGLGFLATRQSYESYITPRRVAVLRAAIIELGPSVVVFYGSGHRASWNAIAGNVTFARIAGGGLVARSGKTTFVQVDHPAAHSASKNTYWTNTGAAI